MAEVTGRDYARFFFDDIIDAGLEQLHAELGWFTETDQRDPLIQLFRFVAYLGHRDAAIMDLIAGELAWKTLQRRASAVVLADLVGQRLTADSPSNADILFDLFGTPGVADVLVPDLAIFRTAADSDTAAVPFENQDGSQVVGAGGLDYLLIADNGGVFTGPAASIANPWGPVPALNDALYFGHANMMFSSLQFVASGTPDDYYAAWEYYDGRFRTSQPDNGTVAVSGPGITMDVDDFLGDTATSYVGLTIRVRHTTSDVEEVVVVASGHSITTATTLGQSVVSTAEEDYELTADWLPWGNSTSPHHPNGAATTDDVEPEWSETGNETNLPQGPNRKWQKTTVNGTSAYWVRARVTILEAAPAGPANSNAAPIDDTVWTGLVDTLQGATVVDVIGTTTGAAFDRFRLNETPFIDSSVSVLDVGGDADYTEVEDFFASEPQDKHFRVEETVDGDFEVVLADGINGILPSAGNLVTATYRINADDDGNVGRGTIKSVDAAVSFVNNIRNPRDASGWRQKQGATASALENVRRTIPGAVRAGDRAVTPEDYEILAVQRFVTADGRRPFERVIAVEEGAGFKTIRLVCVGAGGTVPTVADLGELEEYFNGTKSGFQRFDGKGLANQEIKATAVDLVEVDVTATAEVLKRNAVAAQTNIAAIIEEALQPLAVTSDGTYRHVPGIDLEDATLKLAVGESAVPGLINLTFSSPSFPVSWSQNQLPTPGTIAVTVTEV